MSLRIKQYTARAHGTRAHVTRPVVEPRPVEVAPFGWLSRDHARRDANLVRTNRARG